MLFNGEREVRTRGELFLRPQRPPSGRPHEPPSTEQTQRSQLVSLVRVALPFSSDRPRNTLLTDSRTFCSPTNVKHDNVKCTTSLSTKITQHDR